MAPCLLGQRSPKCIPKEEAEYMQRRSPKTPDLDGDQGNIGTGGSHDSAVAVHQRTLKQNSREPLHIVRLLLAAHEGQRLPLLRKEWWRRFASAPKQHRRQRQYSCCRTNSRYDCIWICLIQRCQIHVRNLNHQQANSGQTFFPSFP